MARWEDFEINCEQWLKRRFPEVAPYISRQGGADSTISDILVDIPGCDPFYIECKMPYGCHFGQMVLYDCGDYFAPMYPAEVYQDAPYMNEVLACFNDYKTYNVQAEMALITGISPEDEFEEDSEEVKQIIADAVVEHYINKGAWFLMTGRFSGAGPLIMPLYDDDRKIALEQVFDFNYVVRDKKSGSAPCPRRYSEDVIEYLEYEYGIYPEDLEFDVYDGKNRLMVYNVGDYGLVHDTRFEVDAFPFKLRNREQGLQEVVKLSNTANTTLLLTGKMKPDEEIPDDVFLWGIEVLGYLFNSEKNRSVW